MATSPSYLDATRHLGLLTKRPPTTFSGDRGDYNSLLGKYRLKKQDDYNTAILDLGNKGVDLDKAALTQAEIDAAAAAAAAKKNEDLATAGLVIGGLGTAAKLIDTDIGKSVVTKAGDAVNWLKDLWPKPTTAPLVPESTIINAAEAALTGGVPAATGALAGSNLAGIGSQFVSDAASTALAAEIGGMSGGMTTAAGGVGSLGGGGAGTLAAMGPGLAFSAIYAALGAIDKANDAPGWNPLQAYADYVTTGKYGTDAPQAGRNYPVGIEPKHVIGGYQDYLAEKAGIKRPNANEGEGDTPATYNELAPEQKAIIDEIIANPEKYPNFAMPFTTAQWNIMQPRKKEATEWGD